MSNAEALFDEYARWLIVEKGRSRATVEAYRSDVSGLIEWMRAEAREVQEVTSADLDRYFSAQRLEGRAANSVARAVSSVRGWLGFLTEEGTITSDPSTSVRPVTRGRSLPKPLGEEEVNRLLDSLVASDPLAIRDRALLELLYGTGARVSEALGVALGDLDFDEQLVLVTGKGSKQRLVPMGAQLEHSLMRYLEGPRARLLAKGRSDRLFLNARGGVLTRQGVDGIIAKRAFAAGIERSRVSAHVFRHSCATHMLAHGADVRVVQELLGHASIATTQIYTAVSITSLQREYEQAHPRAHE